MNKVYVAVKCRWDGGSDPYPLRITWKDGRSWDIQRLLHTCRAPDGSFDGTRYTVLINGLEKYLYRDGQGWYVVPVAREDNARNEKPYIICRNRRAG